MTSTIQKDVITKITGSSTGTTGKTTITFPAITGRALYLFVYGKNTATLMVTSDSTIATADTQLVITAKGHYQFEISGCEWYTTPYAINVY